MNIRTYIQHSSWTNIGKRVLSILLFALVAFLFLYGYFVSSSVVNVLVRKEIEQDLAAVSSRISDLEAQYLAEKNQITLEFAKNKGFYNVAEKSFATRASDVAASLTLNNE